MHGPKRLLVVGTGFYGREILSGICAYCGPGGSWEFRLEDCTAVDTAKRIGLAITQWKADGVIAFIRSNEMQKLLLKSPVPVVNVSGARDIDLPTVRTDNLTVGQTVARHFLDNGFRNFGFCAMTHEFYATLRCRGFLSELSAAGFGASVLTDECTGATELNWVRNRKRMDAWLVSLPKPVGVMCLQDIRGQDVIQSCRHLGLKVPEQVAVVGVGNEEILCRMCVPPLSSVQIDNQRIGFEAARLLDQMIHRRPLPKGHLLVRPRGVIVRQSSETVAIEDPEIAAAARFIREHAAEPITVKNILREVPISRRAMEMRFVKLIGRTPREEMTRIRLDRAKSLLTETRLPIPAVARAAGFTCPVSFSDFFRRAIGKTPTQYRQDWQTVEMQKGMAVRLQIPATGAVSSSQTSV